VPISSSTLAAIGRRIDFSRSIAIPERAVTTLCLAAKSFVIA
jgi:hypothetical protein